MHNGHVALAALSFRQNYRLKPKEELKYENPDIKSSKLGNFLGSSCKSFCCEFHSFGVDGLPFTRLMMRFSRGVRKVVRTRLTAKPKRYRPDWIRDEFWGL